MDRKAELMAFVRDELLHDGKANINDDEDLLGGGVIDSIGILRLVGFIEEKFGIRVPDEDVIYDNFHSIQAMNEYLNSSGTKGMS